MTRNRRSQTSLSALILSILFAAAALGACASSAPPAETPPAEPAGRGDGSDSKDATAGKATEPAAKGGYHFDDMSPGQKLEHMKKVVAPKMAKVFSESEEEESAEFSCKTCHGKGVAAGDFTMPSPDLPKLSDELIASHPEATEFMKTRVVPEMRALLGEDDFSCGDCHQQAQ